MPGGPAASTLADALVQRHAVHELEHEGRHAAALFDAVDSGDVWVIQGREHARLALEPRQAVGISGEGLWQDLDGHMAPEAGIVRAVYLAHTAGAHECLHVVHTETTADE